MKRGPESILTNPSALKSTKIDERPLHLQLLDAAKSGEIEVVNYLICQGVNVNQGDDEGCTPLHIAAWNGYSDIVALLIESGANINKDINNGSNPLYMAAEWGHIKTAELLIESGAKVNQANRYNGRTPIHVAVENGHIETAILLIKNSADVNQIDYNSSTPLHKAAFIGHNQAVEILIVSGAKVNQGAHNDVSPLCIAALRGHDDTVKLLIEKDASIHQMNSKNQTPLEIAKNCGFASTQRILEDAIEIERMVDNALLVNQKETPFLSVGLKTLGKFASWAQGGISEEELLKKKLFSLMYKRVDAVLSSFESQNSSEDFVCKASENLNNKYFLNLAVFDSFLMKNSTFLNAGRGLAHFFPREVAVEIASYVPGYNRATGLFQSGYAIEVDRSNRALKEQQKEIVSKTEKRKS